MKSVPAAFSNAIKATVRRIRAKIDVLWTDPFVLSGMTVSSSDTNHTSWHDPHIVDTKTITPHKYLILDGTCTSDGTYYAAPYTTEEQQNNQFGWYSESVADGSGDFSPYPDVTVTFADPRPIRQLTVVGEPALGQYPAVFDIYIYDSTPTEIFHESYTNDSVVKNIDLTGESINNAKSMKLVVKKWSDANTVAKIVEFFGVVSDTFYEDDIVSLGLLEEREIKDGSLPIGNISSNEIDLELQNIKVTRATGEEVKDPYFPDNAASYISSSITPNVRITAYLGVEWEGAMEEEKFVKVGTFWTKDWTVDEDNFFASVSARDRLDILKNVEFRLDEVLKNHTLKEIAEHILDHAKEHIPLADLTWEIDDELKNFTIPYAWFGKVNYMEAMAKIAEACLGQCYMSKDDVLIVESFQANAERSPDLTITRDEYFSRKQPINGSDLKNHIEVQISPIQPESESSEIKTTDEIEFEAGVDDIEDYLIEWGDDAYDVPSAVIEEESGVSVSISKSTYYAWGCLLSFHKNSGTSGTFKVRLSGKKYVNIEPTKVILPGKEDEPTDSQKLYGKKEYVYKENFLIQDSGIATTIATRLLESYADPRKDVSIDWIGNPALELGDVIHVPVYTPNDTGESVYDDFVIYNQKYDFDGGLRCVTKARKLVEFSE